MTIIPSRHLRHAGVLACVCLLTSASIFPPPPPALGSQGFQEKQRGANINTDPYRLMSAKSGLYKPALFSCRLSEEVGGGFGGLAQHTRCKCSGVMCKTGGLSKHLACFSTLRSRTGVCSPTGIVVFQVCYTTRGLDSRSSNDRCRSSANKKKKEWSASLCFCKRGRAESSSSPGAAPSNVHEAFTKLLLSQIKQLIRD